MGVLFSSVVYEGLGLSAHAQPAWFEAHIDLVPVESRKSCAYGELFFRFREVQLHGGKKFGFGEEPIPLVVSVDASMSLENLEGAESD
jgi:hypothetical protein